MYAIEMTAFVETAGGLQIAEYIEPSETAWERINESLHHARQQMMKKVALLEETGDPALAWSLYVESTLVPESQYIRRAFLRLVMAASKRLPFDWRCLPENVVTPATNGGPTNG